MTAGARGPAIRFPPPLVFVAGFLVAWWLDRRLGFEIDGAGAGRVQIALGTALVGGGLGFMFWGMGTFIKARTPVVPIKPARQLVTGGPYRFTRNPMYVGLTALYVGLALLINAAWPLVLLPFVLLTLSAAVIALEERYLRARFGASYDDYCARVRRWL